MYGKAWAAVAYVVAIALQAALDDRHLTAVEGVQLGIALLTAAGVYVVPLTSNYKWMKTAVAMGLAVLQTYVTVLLSGGADWLTIATATVAAFLVWLAPATSLNPSGTGDVSVPLGLDV